MKKLSLLGKIILGVAALGCVTTTLGAEKWPNHELRLLVPFGAGSNPDIVARLVAKEASDILDQAIVVENRPGAGGNIATGAVAKSRPDGYTFGLSINGPLVYNQYIVKHLGYDPQKDLSPLTLAATQPNVIVASKSTGAKTLQELIDLLKANPGKFNFATVGIGSGSHLTSELLLKTTGTQAVAVPYKGSPDAVSALLAGDVQFASLAPGAVVNLGKEGKLYVLAQASAQRSKALPDIPTVAETGVADITSQAWNGFIISSKVDANIQAKLQHALYTALSNPTLQQKFRDLYMDPIPSSPQEFAAFMKQESEQWKPLIDSLNIRQK